MSGGGDRRLGLSFAVLAAAGALALGPAPSASASPSGVPPFRHALVVLFENKEIDEIAGNRDAPTFAELASRYASLTSYEGVAHPSLPNYLALVSGSTHGIESDCTTCVVHAKNLADTLESRHLTWKTYAEDLPAAGFTGAFAGDYAKKHDPFLYFADVAGSARRRANVVPFSRLASDLAKNRLPTFSLIVPNQCNDMHSCPVATGDAWLRQHIVPLLANRALTGSVVFVVFDEGNTDLGGGGHVDALALGPLVRRGATFWQPTSHYALLRTLEDAWRLPRLGQSAHATPITGIWR